MDLFWFNPRASFVKPTYRTTCRGRSRRPHIELLEERSMPASLLGANNAGFIFATNGLTSTTTAITSSPNASLFGQPVTFMAAVTPTPHDIGIPTGSITFEEGKSTLGTASLDANGIASFTTASALPAGAHMISAVYNGDQNFASSMSSPLDQIVDRAAAAITLETSANTSTFSQLITFTATVTGPVGTPTGTVTFREGSAALGTAALNGVGVATVSTSALSPGAHTLVADYSGDTNLLSVGSDPITQLVNAGSTTVSVTSSANPLVSRQPVTFTASIRAVPPSEGTPAGTVTFRDETTTLGTVSLDRAGNATVTTQALGSGRHSITAVYSGDGNFAPSTSSSFSQTITANPNEAFVTALYRDVLHRTPDAAGFHFWVQQLQAGFSRTTVASAFETSAEYRGLEVDQFYQTFFHRSADAAGRALWVNALMGGRSEADVAVAFLTSAEYTATHADNASFVSGLYQDVLSHGADPAGAATWLGILQRGAQSRAQVAMAFLSSTEAYLEAIDSYYAQFLGRPADSFGRQAYLAALQNGKFIPTGITTVFLASDEFLARAITLAGE